MTNGKKQGLFPIPGQGPAQPQGPLLVFPERGVLTCKELLILPDGINASHNFYSSHWAVLKNSMNLTESYIAVDGKDRITAIIPAQQIAGFIACNAYPAKSTSVFDLDTITLLEIAGKGKGA